MLKEGTTAVTEAQTESPSAPSEVNRINSILDESLGFEDDTPKEEPSAQPANAPDKGNPDEETQTAPGDGEPASPEDKTAEGKADEKGEEGEDDESDSALNALLDMEPEEKSDDPGVWKGRYSDATRHIGELNERLKAVNEALLSQGRQLINTAKGLEIAVTDEAKQLTSEAVDPKAIYEGLTKSERELFIDDPEQAAKMLVEKAVNKIAENFIPATAKSSDAVLTQAEADQVFDDFVACKLPDGKTSRFPDADNEEVKALMSKAYNANTPAMQKFRDIAAKDKDMQYALLEHLFLKVYRARQAQLAVKAAKQKAVTETQKEHKKESKLSSGGSSGTVAGQRLDAATKSEADRIGGILDEALG